MNCFVVRLIALIGKPKQVINIINGVGASYDMPTRILWNLLIHYLHVSVSLKFMIMIQWMSVHTNLASITKFDAEVLSPKRFWSQMRHLFPSTFHMRGLYQLLRYVFSTHMCCYELKSHQLYNRREPVNNHVTTIGG